MTEPQTVPFTIVNDSREKDPYGFMKLHADAKENHAPLIVPTVVKGLQSGDYSIVGYEDRIAIERKSFEDLFQTLGRGRERFVRELERLNQLEFAAVVCECSWQDIAFHRPDRSEMNSKTVMRSIFAFQIRYTRCHWIPAGNRAMAEGITFRLLQRFWLDDQRAKSESEAAA